MKQSRLNLITTVILSLLLILIQKTDAHATITPQIAAGESHMVALHSEGTVWSWGGNSNGQLGNGTTTSSSTPTQVAGLTNVAAVAAGNTHTLALKNDGTVWSWGGNSNGQLGDGTTLDHYIPTQVAGLSGVIAISTGATYSLALRSDGLLYAWGCNTYGQLGDGSTNDRLAPVQVSNLSSIISVSGGTEHTLALKSDGTVWTWGRNNQGQLGNGTISDSTTPFQVLTLSSVVTLTTKKDHSIALTNNGTIWAWGKNTHGQLGIGPSSYTTTPVQAAANLSGVIAIAVGNDHTQVLKSDGTVWGWGATYSGQLGNGIVGPDSIEPLQATAVTDIIMIDCGTAYTAALKADGTILVWGATVAGQSGIAAPTYYDHPVRMNAPSGLIQLAPSFDHTLALREDGTVWAWGGNSVGQLGIGTVTASVTPVQVPGLADIVAVAAGRGTSFALKRDGTVWAWGYNHYGQLGISCTNWHCEFPEEVIGLTDVAALTAEFYFPVALKRDGTVWRIFGNILSQVSGLESITAVSANPSGCQTLALKSDGTVWIWESNGYSGGPEGRTAVQVSGLSNITAIADGAGTGLALAGDGNLWAWGGNSYGQVGDNTYTDRPIPVPVTELAVRTDAKVTAITSVGGTSVALVDDGTVWSWGYAAGGRLGGGYFNGTSSLKATQAIGLGDVMAVFGGAGYTVALQRDGTAWGWGSNEFGQITGQSGNSIAFPVPVNLILTITTASVSPATTGAPYSQTITAASGVPPYSYSISAGSLPAGISLSGAGILSGIPEESGAATFTVQVTGANGVTATRSFLLTVHGAPWVTGYQPANGATVPLSATVQASFSEPVDPATLNQTTFSVSGFKGVTAVAAGIDHAIALKHDGTVIGWGSNSDEQITTPKGLSGVIAIAAGAYHNLALKNDGTVVAWGKNDWDQNNWGQTVVPAGLSGVTAVAAGYDSSVALKSDGTLVSWGGYNGVGYNPPPAGLSSVSSVVAGHYHTLAVKNDGTVVGWGSNNYGQITIPEGLSGVTAVAPGWYFSLALKNDGTVVAWGNESSGQLKPPAGLSGVIAIAAGAAHAVALKNDGTVVVWGWNNYGVRVVPSGLTGVTAIASGENFIVALKADGTLVSWGVNNKGQSTIPSGPGSPYSNPLSGSYSYDAATRTASFTPSSPLSSYGTYYVALTGVRNLSGIPLATPVNWSFSAMDPLAINPSTLPSTVIGADYSQALSGTGGATPYTWVISAGELPDGLTLNSSTGVISGSPLFPGESPFTVTMTDAHATSTSRIFAIPVFGIATTALPHGIVGASYSQPVILTGGTAPFTWSLLGGSLPDGLTIDASTGVISGTPTSVGTFSFTVQVSDGGANSFTRNLAITIGYTGQVYTWGSNYYGELGINSTTEKSTPVPVPGLASVTSVAAGSLHTLALKSDGSVWSWGNNSSGQLGDGTTSTRRVPVLSIGVSGVTAIAAGDSHSVVLKNDGTVWSWGYNYSGQLGDSTTAQRNAPVQVAGTSDITAIAAGRLHTLALRSDGMLWSWGDNDNGQLGDATTTDRLKPVQVTGLSGATAIAGGYTHSLALKSDGTVWAWGSNSYGQIGDGSVTQRTIPVQVTGLSGVIAIAAGRNHSLALKSDGTVWAWGDNSSGQIGDGTISMRLSPVKVAGLTGIVAIDGGSNHSIAVKTDGTVWSWGYNSFGELGNGSGADYLSTPVQATGLSGVTGVSAGGDHSIALVPFRILTETLPDGASTPYSQPLLTSTGIEPFVWVIAAGELPPGLTIDQAGLISGIPTTSGTFTFTVGVVTGNGIPASRQFAITVAVSPTSISTSTLAIATADTAYSQTLTAVGGTEPYTWAVIAGNLPPGLTLDSSTGVIAGTSTLPGTYLFTLQATDADSLATSKILTISVFGITTFSLQPGALAVPYAQELRVETGTPPFIWTIADGNLPAGLTLDSGTGRVSGTPGATGKYSFLAQLTDSAERSHTQWLTLVIREEGNVFAWGTNTSGQLGDGTTQNRSTPVQTADVAGVIAIAAGNSSTIALKADGTVWSWGSNGYGQLGDGTTTTRTTPVQVSGLTGITAIAAGASHTVALKEDGTVWTWGYNSYGQLGDGTTTNRSTPGRVAGLSGITAITGGADHTIALKEDGTVVSWGNNNYGQLGDGTTSNRTLPGAVNGVSQILAIATGDYHTLALKADTSVWSWGNNNYGQLGDGTTNSRSTPVLSAAFGATAIAAVRSSNSMMLNNGTVRSWGYSGFGLVGGLTPAPVSGLSGMTAISGGGYYHASALKADGTVWSWGYNGSGQLGDGTSTNRSTPVQAAGLSGVIALTGGYMHTVALAPFKVLTDNLPELNLPVTGSTLSSTIGNPQYTWTIAGGALPPGLSLSASGILSGTPVEGGSYSFAVKGTDRNGRQVTHDFNVTVTSLPVRIIGTGTRFYQLLQEAFNAAVNGETIEAYQNDFVETININTDSVVTIRGGYGVNFTVGTQPTVISGSLTITRGTVTVDNLSIR